MINWRSRVNFGISYREVWEFDIHLNSHLCMLFVFSLQFQSHQIFHVLVVAAAFVHLYGICQMAYYRFHHGTACENWPQGLINPLSPNSDQDQFSPNNIHTLSTDKLWELIKWSPKRKCFDLQPNSLNLFLKEMYKDQFGEFLCGYWGLKG